MLDEAPERVAERLDKRRVLTNDQLAVIKFEIRRELDSTSYAITRYLDNPQIESMNPKQSQPDIGNPIIRESLEATQSQKIDIEALSDVMFGLAAEFAAGQKTASMTQLQMRKFLLNLFKQG